MNQNSDKKVKDNTTSQSNQSFMIPQLPSNNPENSVSQQQNTLINSSVILSISPISIDGQITDPKLVKQLRHKNYNLNKSIEEAEEQYYRQYEREDEENNDGMGHDGFGIVENYYNSKYDVDYDDSHDSDYEE